MTPSSIVSTVLKPVTLAMGVAGIVLITLQAAPTQTILILLNRGLFAPAVAALSEQRR